MNVDKTEVVMVHKVACGLCDDPNAEYDAKLQSGPWAYLCKKCFNKYAGRLGTGLGQRLIYKDGAK